MNKLERIISKVRPRPVSRTTMLKLLAGELALVRHRINPQPAGEDEPWPTEGSHTLISDLLENARGGWCPNGEPGQQFWLREAFSYTTKQKASVQYRADVPEETAPPVFWYKPYLMPRELCRLGAEVVRVFAQSEVDADNELVWYWVLQLKPVAVEALRA